MVGTWKFFREEVKIRGNLGRFCGMKFLTISKMLSFLLIIFLSNEVLLIPFFLIHCCLLYFHFYFQCWPRISFHRITISISALVHALNRKIKNEKHINYGLKYISHYTFLLK